MLRFRIRVTLMEVEAKLHLTTEVVASPDIVVVRTEQLLALIDVVLRAMDAPGVWIGTLKVLVEEVRRSKGVSVFGLPTAPM